MTWIASEKWWERTLAGNAAMRSVDAEESAQFAEVG